MRRTPLAIVSLALALGIGVWFVWYVVDSTYLVERRTLVQQVRSITSSLANVKKDKADQKRIEAQLQGYIERTLGGDLETVDHKFRARLNRLAEHVQLQNHVVGTKASGKWVETPAKSIFRGPQRPLGEEPDFVELEGWVNGIGTLEQALRLIDRIEAEPWIKRIEELRLDPSDNGSKVRVDVRVTTLFLPGAKPKADGQILIGAPRHDRFASLVSNNPFRVPPPAPAPPPEPKPSTPGEFQYGQWKLTGIAQTSMGPEAWLLNVQAKQSRHLNVGDKLHEMTFVRTDGETAEFQLGTQRFTIVVGKNLNDRTPVNH